MQPVNLNANVFIFQIWAKGSKPGNAPGNDLEANQISWGVGANITTRLLNAGGEVQYDECQSAGDVVVSLRIQRSHAMLGDARQLKNRE